MVVHGLMKRNTKFTESDVEVAGPRAGVTVSKAVGPAHVRNRVARVLRHAIRDNWASLPPGSMWVVRALPTAGPKSVTTELARDVAEGLRSVLSQ